MKNKTDFSGGWAMLVYVVLGVVAFMAYLFWRLMTFK